MTRVPRRDRLARSRIQPIVCQNSVRRLDDGRAAREPCRAMSLVLVLLGALRAALRTRDDGHVRRGGFVCRVSVASVPCSCVAVFTAPGTDLLRAARSAALLLLDALAELVLLPADLARRVGGGKILRLVEGADLNLGVGARQRVGTALHPLHRLVHRLHLPEPIPGNQLLGLGERAVVDGSLRARELHPLPQLARLEALAGEHDAAFTNAP